MFSRLIDESVFFVIAWQKYGDLGASGASVMTHFKSTRPDKMLVELDCLRNAINAQLADEEKKIRESAGPI